MHTIYSIGFASHSTHAPLIKDCVMVRSVSAQKSCKRAVRLYDFFSTALEYPMRDHAALAFAAK